MSEVKFDSTMTRVKLNAINNYCDGHSCSKCKFIELCGNELEKDPNRIDKLYRKMYTEEATEPVKAAEGIAAEGSTPEDIGTVITVKSSRNIDSITVYFKDDCIKG